ncbi:GNAT family N-acetyltransferase [Alkaliphilus transvaalensis]|uniref:GNAT family N-acetyltransferase n=1 Tax=Alkaliphilus transvaalensis TaxID=114628 RepID=UPI00068555CE|nr:GNAT family N-acetyltransferase [Alkaliphilus transvaalensis]
MTKLNFTPFPNLKTERLFMRQISLLDLEEIFLLKSDQEVLKYLDEKSYETYDEAAQFIHKIIQGVSNKQWILWGITTTESHQLIGTVCLWNFSEDETKADIGFDLLPDFQGLGYMEEAVSRVIDYGFKVLELKVIAAVTHELNSKARKLLEKKGFTVLKSLREHSRLEGQTFNFLIYGLLNQVIQH